MLLSGKTGKTNRQAAVAGSFYPAGHDFLVKEVKDYTDGKVSAKQDCNVRAIIAPHAGYVFSGSIAGSAYAYVTDWHKYKRVFIIGSSHHQQFNGAALYTEGNYLTPLGEVKVDREICSDLIGGSKYFTNYPTVHNNEHSIEVQLPFLQYMLKNNLIIIPILIGTNKAAECKEIASALQPWFKPDNLFVFSSDFSHYPEYSNAYKLDSLTSEKIISGSAGEFLDWVIKCEKEKSYGALTPMCGWTAGLVLKYLAESISSHKFIHIDYANSGDSKAGNKNGVVGYHAIALVEENKEGLALSDSDKLRLLRLARENIGSRLHKGKFITSDKADYKGMLSKKLGAFVTLRKDNKLRGCIGKINASEPLFETIRQMSIAAAFNDSRFDPVQRDELDKIRIEISVLSEMKKIENIDEIIPGKHGIYLKKGLTSATFLPQVAVEQKWNREELLGNLSKNKAGLDWSGWKDADIYIYEAIVFEEDI